MASVASQIFVEPRIRDNDLKESLRDEGVTIGYPFCSVHMETQDKIYRLAEIFEYYGWQFEVHGGYYSATQNVEEIEI